MHKSAHTEDLGHWSPFLRSARAPPLVELRVGADVLVQLLLLAVAIGRIQRLGILLSRPLVAKRWKHIVHISPS